MKTTQFAFFSRILVIIFVVLAVSVTMLIAFSSGPPNGRTGAPGDLTCNAGGCHNSFSLNSGGGVLDITGIPETGYEPDQTYSIEITLSKPGQSRWGFEAVILTSGGSNAGTINVTDNSRTQKSQSGSKTYIKHTSLGTSAGSWSFDWQAPSTDVGEITIYAAGNAANSSNSPSGDYIYTTSFTREAAAPTSALEEEFTPFQFKLHGNFPNPFNPATTIRYELEKPGIAAIRIFDLTGQEIRTLISLQQAAGIHSVTWDGNDNFGRSVSSGTYFVRLQTENRSAVSRMLLIR